MASRSPPLTEKASGTEVATWVRALQTGETYEVEFRLRAANGNYRWYRSRALPQHDEHGAIVAWFGTNTDIPDQRR